MASNSFTGTLPTEVLRLNQSLLIAVDYSDNKFNGTIPTEYGLLTKLYYLSLHMNKLSGTIPTEIGKLSMSS